jgi:hypothetical protein
MPETALVVEVPEAEPLVSDAVSLLAEDEHERWHRAEHFPLEA